VVNAGIQGGKHFSLQPLIWSVLAEEEGGGVKGEIPSAFFPIGCLENLGRTSSVATFLHE